MSADAPITRREARELAALEFNSRHSCEQVGWLYLFQWAGLPL